jgi:hypothetical protein
MNAERFTECGRLLFGPLWQCEMARAIGISDRTVRRWAKGEQPVRQAVAEELDRRLRERADEIGRMMEGVE